MIYNLINDQIRRNAIQAVTQAPENYRCEIKERTRSLDQNAKLHALFGEASKNHTWQGRKLSPIQWKVLFISGHSMATGRGADMVPGLEGEFVNIRESSANMSVSRMTSLIEYVQAWMVEQEAIHEPM